MFTVVESAERSAYLKTVGLTRSGMDLRPLREFSQEKTTH
jgi:hypothetical protein